MRSFILDVARKISPTRKIKRIALLVLGLIALLLVTLGLSRLKPAAPSVDRATLWMDKVKRGPMLREVRGTGTLVPIEVQWISAATDGRVLRVHTLVGTVVKSDTVLLELSNPDVELAARDAELQLKAAEADLAGARVRLQNQEMDQEAAAAAVKTQYMEAKLRAEADESLAKDGLVADITLKTSRAKAEELATRYEIEKKRLEINSQSIQIQLQVPQTRIDQIRALYSVKRAQVEGLNVRAGSDGVLQQLPVQVGQRVAAGTVLAKVANPSLLKAELKIPETQAKDIQIGLPASIDTRNGIIPGSVIRIDPASQNGTVTVDASLEGPLPKGARPDLTVDGTIELERLDQVLYVGRPASAQDQSTLGLFKVAPDGKTADRVKVQFGRSSVSTIEVQSGLREGDQVVLSDTSQWDSYDHIRLN